MEPHVRRLVADHLGVGAEELTSDVGLRDDLAADSLDLLELAMVLEEAFAIVIPERILEEVRTYADLVHATGLLVNARCEAEANGAQPVPRIRVRIIPRGGESCGTLERSGWLTAYAAETIAEDALRAGRGARLEVTVAATTTAALARVERRFAALGERGILLTVRCDDRPATLPGQSTADRVAERREVATAGAQFASTHRLLDELTGAPAAVTLVDHCDADPWQPDALIASADQGATRFGDGRGWSRRGRGR